MVRHHASSVVLAPKRNVRKGWSKREGILSRLVRNHTSSLMLKECQKRPELAGENLFGSSRRL
jgi:hypothetical protein